MASETNEEKVGSVASLHVYPVKSLCGLAPKEAQATAAGLLAYGARDRFFVVVKPNGDFVTQRQLPKMSAVNCKVEAEQLILTSDLMPSACSVPLCPELDQSKVSEVRVWKDRLQGQDCGDSVASWLSQALGAEVRLAVSLPQMGRRPVAKAPDHVQVAYPDSSPVLVVNTASVADLKSRIPDSDEINVLNFRPNIVVETTKPWDEDNWASIRIGENKLKLLDPCTRCVLTTVDSKTRERRPDGEPLKTLKSFRLFPEVSKSSPLFGVFTCFPSDGKVTVGDPVFITRKS